jgi:hypothetical protein
VASELVRVVGGVTQIIDFDAEGVTVETTATNAEFETLGPDYDLSANGPLFTDSPCVRRWKEVIIDTSIYTRLSHYYESTPITCGYYGPSCTGDYLFEALYVKDLTVNSGKELVVQGMNVYYTGTVTNNGEITTDGEEAYTPIQLNPTLYGDFDGDDEGDETADVDRFNDAFPSDFGDAEYDPLVDWDCNGSIDCDDRAQYIANWDPAGIEDDSCP